MKMHLRLIALVLSGAFLGCATSCAMAEVSKQPAATDEPVMAAAPEASAVSDAPVLAVPPLTMAVPAAPVIALKAGEDAVLSKALLVGPFAHPFDAGMPGRGGFDVDYLAEAGGEAEGRVENYNFAARLIDESQMRKWDGVLKPNTMGVAYAIVDVEADADAERVCLFGSDDYAKVWLNGKLVHEVWQDDGRAITPEQENFTLALRKGLNRLVFKIEQKQGGWGLVAKLVTAEKFAATQAERRERIRLDRFRFDALFAFDEEAQEPRERVLPFIKGKLPGIVFQNPELAAEVADMGTFKARWFDANANEITNAATQVAEPGLYCAYVEVIAKNGLILRRVAPVYFAEDFHSWRPSGLFEKGKADFAWNDGLRPKLPEAAWNARDLLLRDTLNMTWGHGMMFDAVPLLFAELSLDAEPAGAWRESAYSNVHDYLVRLRRNALGRPAPKTLPPPAVDHDATALRAGTEAEAGLKSGSMEAVRAACKSWVDSTSNGLVIVVARRGVIALHEAFPGANDARSADPDELRDGGVSIDSRLPTASVTKLHAGLLLGRYLDQGLLDLDDPVAKYFPDFPAEGAKAITVRQLMNHTSGLDGHRWYMGLEGMANPFLENVARWDIERVEPGVQWIYNGFGIDLGGKVIEDVSGRSVFRSMRDDLFAPLGQDRPTINDLGYGLNCTALDLARVADLCRQRGAYDGKRYMSRETFAKLLPMPVDRHNPNFDRHTERGVNDYGVGISWMRDAAPADADEDADDAAAKFESAEPEYILGKNVFGHGSACGTVFRVAPDHDLIVTIARYTPGKDYDAHLARVMQAIADGLE